MQEQRLWPMMICGAAAMRAVTRIGDEERPLRNPLPPGEGRVRVCERLDFGRTKRPNPHPVPLPEGEGELHRAGGSIVAVFARSFYLADAAGGLACIGPVGLGSGPLNVLCDLPRDLDWQARGLRPGQTARYRGEVLRIDGIGAFSFANAVAWRPPPSSAWNAATLARGLAALAAATEDCDAGGFAPLVAAMARGRMCEVATCAIASPLLRLAAPGIAALADWLAAPGKDAPPGEAAAILIGLGPGLTPSGDDLVGGAMIALHALGRADVAARLAAWALPLAETRTGTISRAHLACAAAGEGSASLHDLLAGLLTADAAAIAAAVTALAAIGHSSGWDMLAGATLACAPLVCVGLSA